MLHAHFSSTSGLAVGGHAAEHVIGQRRCRVLVRLGRRCGEQSCGDADRDIDAWLLQVLGDRARAGECTLVEQDRLLAQISQRPRAIVIDPDVPVALGDQGVALEHLIGRIDQTLVLRIDALRQGALAARVF